jgi:ATP-dependent DNA ligase
MVKRASTRVQIPGAKPSEMPGFIKPQLATLKSRAPKGNWLHEIKYDGYRVQIHLNKGKRRVYTRNGLDWTKRFSLIAAALDLSGQTIIDGEAAVIHDGRGRVYRKAILAVGFRRSASSRMPCEEGPAALTFCSSELVHS